MAKRVKPKRPPRHYLAERREAAKMTQEALGARVGVTGVTVSRWETGKRRPDLNVLAACAEAMGRHLADMFVHPDAPSADALLRGKSDEVVARAIRAVLAVLH